MPLAERSLRGRIFIYLSIWSRNLVFQDDLSVKSHQLNGQVWTLGVTVLRQDDDVEGRQEGEAGRQRPRLPQVQVRHLLLLLQSKTESYIADRVQDYIYAKTKIIFL